MPTASKSREPFRLVVPVPLPAKSREKRSWNDASGPLTEDQEILRAICEEAFARHITHMALGLDVSGDTISAYIMTGKRNPSDETMEKVAGLLGMNAAMLRAMWQGHTNSLWSSTTGRWYDLDSMDSDARNELAQSILAGDIKPGGDDLR